MCVIVIKNRQQKLAIRDMEDMFIANSDSVGIMWQDGQKVYWDRAIPKNWKACKKWLKKFKQQLNDESIFVAVHFRIATSGGIRLDTCHPFPVIGDMSEMKNWPNSGSSESSIMLMHNGIFTINNYSPDFSDTQTWAYIVSGSVEKMGMANFCESISGSNILGSNRVIFMDKSGCAISGAWTTWANLDGTKYIVSNDRFDFNFTSYDHGSYFKRAKGENWTKAAYPAKRQANNKKSNKELANVAKSFVGSDLRSSTGKALKTQLTNKAGLELSTFICDMPFVGEVEEFFEERQNAYYSREKAMMYMDEDEVVCECCRGIENTYPYDSMYITLLNSEDRIIIVCPDCVKKTEIQSVSMKLSKYIDLCESCNCLVLKQNMHRVNEASICEDCLDTIVDYEEEYAEDGLEEKRSRNEMCCICGMYLPVEDLIRYSDYPDFYCCSACYTAMYAPSLRNSEGGR